jgi:hypothetical protein
MKKPPPKKINFRLSPPIYQRVKDAADEQDRSVNAEIIERIIQTNVDARIKELSMEIAELKGMIKQLLDK